MTNISTSIEFYISIVGFSVDWIGGCVCSVSREGHCLMLSEQEESSSPAMAWIGLESEALFDACKKKNVEILQNPTKEGFS